MRPRSAAPSSAIWRRWIGDVLRRIAQIKRHQRRRQEGGERLAPGFLAIDAPACRCSFRVPHCAMFDIDFASSTCARAGRCALIAQKAGKAVGETRFLREIVEPVARAEDTCGQPHQVRRGGVEIGVALFGDLRRCLRRKSNARASIIASNRFAGSSTPRKGFGKRARDVMRARLARARTFQRLAPPFQADFAHHRLAHAFRRRARVRH